MTWRFNEDGLVQNQGTATTVCFAFSMTTDNPSITAAEYFELYDWSVSGEWKVRRKSPIPDAISSLAGV